MPTLTGDKLLYITLLIGDFETNIKTKCFLLKLSPFPDCDINPQELVPHAPQIIEEVADEIPIHEDMVSTREDMDTIHEESSQKLQIFLTLKPDHITELWDNTLSVGFPLNT